MADIIVGVDVGASGGIVVISRDGGVLMCEKTPDTIQGHFDLFDIMSVGLQGKRALVIVEKVTGRYGDSASSAFEFGFTAALVHCALVKADIPFSLVHPKTWQKTLSMSRTKGEDTTKWKNRLKARAIELFPEHGKKITLWNADAFLLAYHGIQISKK